MKITVTGMVIGLAIMALNAPDVKAQEALGGEAEVISPEVNDDKTVTFRLKADNANEVKLAGDWMPGEGWQPGTADLVQNSEGIWTYTTDVMPSDLYTYFYLIDGLRTNDPHNVHMVRDVASIFNLFLVEDGQGDLYKVNDVPHGTVSRRWYDSPGNDKQRRITMYTPPGYESGDEEYPVLYLMHGMGGDEEAWVALGRTTQILDNLIARGETKPMIVVMANGNVAQQATPGESAKGFYQPTMQLPNTMDGKMEATFPDILNFVEDNYRVKKEKAGRAIAGLSMGGFHSLHISRYYPDTFNYVGLFSPAIMPGDDATSKVYENMDETLQRQKQNGYELYWIAIGKTDFLFDQVVGFRKKLDELGMPYEYRESEGGHTWRNWRNYLTEFTPMLFKEN
ncbi:MAG: alpha/beta hydrolase-fold protein [Balneolales bacterium]